jgi:hypothetical protein
MYLLENDVVLELQTMLWLPGREGADAGAGCPRTPAGSMTSRQKNERRALRSQR